MVTSLMDSFREGTTSKISSSSADVSFDKKISDNQNYFLKMFMAELKHQDPTQPMDTHHITQSMSTMTQTESTIRNTEAVSRIAQYFEKSMLTEAENYMGKNILYDNSSQEFNGEKVDFEYELKFKKDKLPKDRQNLTRIAIKDSNNKVIFQKQINQLEPGVNKFTWDGIDDNGKQVEKMRRYKIEIEAGYNVKDAAGQNKFTPISSSTNLRGKVTEAYRDQRDNVKLRVNDNTLITMDEIRGRYEEEEETSATASKDSSDYLGYLDKKITVNKNSMTVTNGFGNIEFDNPFPASGRVKVEVFNEKGGLESYILEEAKDRKIGMQSLRWDGRICDSFESLEEMSAAEYSNLPKIPNGSYKYKIYVEDLSSVDEDKFVELNTRFEEEVTGLDFSSGTVKLVTPSGSHRLSEIDKIEVKGADTQSLALQSASCVGKHVTILDNKFGITKDGIGGVSFQLLPPEKGLEYGDAHMKILNNKGEVLQTVIKPAGEISYLGKFEVPEFNELREDSQEAVNALIKDKLGHETYDTIPNESTEDQGKADILIKNLFYQGEIFQDGVSPEEERRVSVAHSGMNEVIFQDEIGSFPAGEYSYSMEVEMIGKDGVMKEMKKVDRSLRDRVVSANIESNGDVKLMLEGNREAKLSDVVAIDG